MEDKSCKTPRWRTLKSKLNNLSVFAFKKRITEDKKALIIDVRTLPEFALHHIPGAIHIDYLAENFLETMEALPKDKNYYVYCRSGRRSIRVCTLMCNGGFAKQQIFNLSPGFLSWVEEYPELVNGEHK